jgi:enoyl-CoA hydratase/carnithine racemase
MGYSSIKFSTEDQIARITLNRPEARNAVTPEVIADLMKAAEEIGDSPDIKALVITGEGESFCAGGDLKYLQQAMASDMNAAIEFGEKFRAAVTALAAIPVPTIAIVNGFTCAGGLELMLAFDMAIAAEDAQIGDQHLNRGMIGGPVMWQLPNRIGLQKAMELVSTGKRLTGKEAESYGLVLRAVPRDRLEDEVEGLLAHYRSKSQGVLKLAKKVLREAPAIRDEQEALKYIVAEWGKYAAAAVEMREGVDAFVEKRDKA